MRSGWSSIWLQQKWRFFQKSLFFQVEFVELPEEESEANESDNLVISHSESEDHDQKGGEGLLGDSKVTKTFITGGKLKC